MNQRKQQVIIRKKKKMYRRKSLQKSIFRVLLILCCGGIVYVLYDISYTLLFSSPYFAIKEIEVEGTSTEETEKIKERLGLEEGNNIFSFRTQELVDRLRTAHPGIKEVLISRELPDRVKLSVTYRDPIAQIAYGERMLFVDDESVIFRLPIMDQKVYLKKMFIPEVIAAGETERQVLIRFLKLLKSMDQPIGRDIVKLHTDIPLEIICYLSDGTKIVWGDLSEEDFTTKYKRMLMVYNDACKRYKKIRYLNMRNWEDGRILVMPRGSAGSDGRY